MTTSTEAIKTTRSKARGGSHGGRVLIAGAVAAVAAVTGMATLTATSSTRPATVATSTALAPGNQGSPAVTGDVPGDRPFDTPGVAFGPAALAAKWASIRYSTAPGLALILSDLYPVK